MARDERHLTFDGEVEHETERAWLFYVTDLGEAVWFPKSQCQLDADETSILCPLWLAREKGLD